MSVEFMNSETHKNLMRAFAGESQARNRYVFAAEQAEEKGMHVIKFVFGFTAAQEETHAKVFYDHLSEMAGENVHIDGTYPIDISESLEDLLEKARHNEYEEHDTVYKMFGEKALEEGFPVIASTFFKIAGIEKIHGDRFGRFLEDMKNGRLFVSNVEEEWMCLNCGFVFKGKTAPKSCPACYHEQGFFIRMTLAPYTGKQRDEKSE